MKILVVDECHLQRLPDGSYWSNGSITYKVLKRPLAVFDEVYVAIRSIDVEEKDSDYVHRCDGPGVTILPIPEYIGTVEYLRKHFSITKKIKEYCKKTDCAIMRHPTAISGQFIKQIDGKMPYALEVVGDPWTHMAPGEYKSVFRPFIRVYWTYLLKKYCMKANGVSYVTEHILQERYPCMAMKRSKRKKYFTSHYSTVHLNDDSHYEPKKYELKSEYKIIHIANSFTTYGKGHKEVIQIISKLNNAGICACAEFIGDGPLRGEFESLAKEKGVEEKIRFVGRLNSSLEVEKALREADLFLFPTHSEGMPRVVLESMYVGTPVVATNVGGIPELLDSQCVANVGDVEALYLICRNMLENPDMLTRTSERNMIQSGKYRESLLQERRVEFYRHLEEACHR